MLDHTRRYDRDQSAFHMQSLSLDKIWKSHGGKTGFVLLVDPRTRSIVGRHTHEHSLKEIGKTISGLIAEA